MRNLKLNKELSLKKDKNRTLFINLIAVFILLNCFMEPIETTQGKIKSLLFKQKRSYFNFLITIII
jgi:hypothetical protein